MSTVINDDGSGIGRRRFLTGVGATALGSAALAGTAAAGRRWEPGKRGYQAGGSRLDGGLWTFASTNGAGKPKTLGIVMTDEAFDAVTTGDGAHFYPAFPRVEGLNFTFAGVDWNPTGHPPVDWDSDGEAPIDWGVPHFDFHFYLVDRTAVDGIELGEATYELPEAMTPPGYVSESALTNGDLPRTIVPDMGEHWFDSSNPTPPYTLVYGVYDPALLEGEGDGDGEITFVEPMISEEFLESVRSGEGLRQRISTPEVFPTAGYYPTRYAVRYWVEGEAFVVTLEGFRWFDGYEDSREGRRGRGRGSLPGTGRGSDR